MLREVLPSLCAYMYFADRDICRFLPLVDSSLYLVDQIDPLFLKLLRVDARYVKCLERARVEEKWKFGYALRRIFWFLYLPFYYNTFHLWAGILGGGVPTSFWNWLFFLIYNLPLYTLLWHLTDYIVYKCYMRDWRKIGYLIDKLSWFSGVIFYILSPLLLARTTAYRIFLK